MKKDTMQITSIEISDKELFDGAKVKNIANGMVRTIKIIPDGKTIFDCVKDKSFDPRTDIDFDTVMLNKQKFELVPEEEEELSDVREPKHSNIEEQQYASMEEKLHAKLTELKSDVRNTYPTATVFANAPLALIQASFTAQIHLLENLLDLPLSKFPLENS